MKTHCRICGSSNLFLFLDLGYTPPADQFLRQDQLNEPETYYPLKVFICENCHLAQLSHTVPCEVLYRRDYPYESSITKSGQIHWDEFANTVYTNYELSNGDFVVDIGSNVGVLLRSFKSLGASVLGIDPASNIVRIAEKNGIETWDEFFSPQIADRIVKGRGKVKVLTATNVFAHIDDLKAFMTAVKVVLAENGIFIFEAPYFGNLIKHLEYDTIYHEHLSYLLLKPIMHLAEMYDMEVIDVEERDIHGGSFRVYVARINKYEVNERVSDFLKKELQSEYYGKDKLLEFSERVEKNRIEIQNLLLELRSKGQKIAAVSAPAKGMTLLNYCKVGGETLDFVTEKSTLKIGRHCPGVHIPVLPDAELIEQKIDYALLLAWNFSDEIINNLSEFRSLGGKFIIPIPEPKII